MNIRKILVFALAVVLTFSLFTICVGAEEIGDGENQDVETNYVRNGGFEIKDSVPADYTPNEWKIISGWFIETNFLNSYDGESYLVAIQSATGWQDITNLDDGDYDFSCWMNPAYNVEEVTVTLTSGKNEDSVTLTGQDSGQLVYIDNFTVTGGSIRIKFDFVSMENFNSSCFIDEVTLVKRPEATPTPVPSPTPKITEKPTDLPTKIPKQDGNDETKGIGATEIALIAESIVLVAAIVVIAVLISKKKK